jgi:hypothetical protein
MINHEITQGSPEWFQLRIGVVTASTFSKILTPKTGELSKQAVAIENEIVAEILTGESDEPYFANYATQRGTQLEPEARRMYEMLTGTEVKRSGFVTNDAGTIGGSADGLVGDDGGLEIKCLYGKNHVAMLFEKEIDLEHKPQVQGLLLVTGRKWWDTMAYHPKMPPSIIRTERDVVYIAKLEAALNQVVANIQAKVAAIREKMEA